MATPTDEDTRPKVLILGEWRKVPDGYPGDASGQLECDQLFINNLAKQLVAELRAACLFNPNPRAKPKSSDTKTNLICKPAIRTTCSGCMFCASYFPLPAWCTNGGAHKIAIRLAPYQCLGCLIMVALALAMARSGPFF